MHSYSIDRDWRRKSTIGIFIISMIISILLNTVFGDAFNCIIKYLENTICGNIVKVLQWLEVNPNVLGVPFWCVVLTAFYNKKAWIWFKRWHNIPDLNGKWVGTLKSTFDDHEINMEMNIQQTWDKISIQTNFAQTNSSSSSNVAAIYVDGNQGTQIFFGYTNNSYDVTTGMQQYSGYNILTLFDNKIKGRYFNDRQNPNPNIKGGNKGTFELERQQ